MWTKKEGNDAKVGERHALIVVSDTKSWKFPFRQGFPVKLQCLMRFSNSSKPFCCVMGGNLNIKFVVMNPKGPSVGYCWSYHY
jgi:hypothetical protein